MTALITGASSGIGLELAKLFAADGHDLVLVARSTDALKDLAADLEKRHRVRVTVIPKDLSRIESCREIYEECREAGLRISFLVNNAGFGGWGPFWKTDFGRETEMMNLNMISLATLTKFFLKDMVEANEGKIFNVASTAAFQPGPLMAVYYATKAFVLSFSEALAEELKETRVTVTALCPGPTDTNFKNAAGMEKSMLFSKHLKMDVGSVAKAGYEGMKAGKVIVVPGFKNSAIAKIVRLIPRSLVRASVRKMQEARSKL